MSESAARQDDQNAASPRRVEAGQHRSLMSPWSVNAKARATALRALQRQLASSQWLSPEEVDHAQGKKIASLLAHAVAHSPYYKRLLGTLPPVALRYPQQYLRELPLLRRTTLQSHYAELCAPWPARHGTAREQHTSGSTGQPVWVRRTDLCQMYWLAFTLRDHLWQRRDFSGTLAAIRVMEGQPNKYPKSFASWGEAVNAYFLTGPMHVLPVSTDVLSQARWLASINPDYLLSYPSNLLELLRVAQEEKLVFPHLREIRTIGETVTASLREAVVRMPGVALTDLYSAQELGVIALQCPESGLYHIQSESVCVEVLNEQDEHCRPGEVGRVIVTDLHNYATPLIRYEVGDYAEVGPVCSCGRGLPTLHRILGRRRNMVVLPDGQCHWPYVPENRMREAMPGIQQCQLVQHTQQQIEVRLVVAESEHSAHALRAQESALSTVIQEALGYPFGLQFHYQSGALEKSSGGKFEEFVCRVG